MIEISNNNIKMLEKAQGEFEVSGVDPIQVLIAWQKQILQLAGKSTRLRQRHRRGH